MSNGNLKQVWSCGGGTQSIAIAALLVQGRLPKPDVSIIVDTGREKQSTWDYMDAVLVSELSNVGIRLQKVSKAEFATCDLWSTNGRKLEIPAFTNQTGEMGKLRNFCSNEWKTRVYQRFLRTIGVTDHVKWMGYSLDEPRRFLKCLDNPFVRLPLVRDVPMRRDGCVSLIQGMGWPPAPRSSCWMCPNQTDDEWRETRENRPWEFLLAVELEKEIQIKDPFAFLHSSGVPLDQVDWSKPQLELARACDSGECFL